VILVLCLGGLWLAERNVAADTAPRKLTVALPDGLSPRTIGFYLAQQDGYFSERGLTVEFVSSGSQAPSRLLADGKVDLAIDLMPVALRLHQSGATITHVAQFFQHSSLALYCRPPVIKPADLHGTTIGVWFGGEESSFYAWMGSLNISTFGEEDGVTVLRQGRVSEALADARLDCVTSTSYLAPPQMQMSGIAPTSRTVFRYEDLGVGTLEDGLYARNKDLQDKDRLDLFTRFLAASSRGWQRLHDDRAEAMRLFRFRADQTSNPPTETIDASQQAMTVSPVTAGSAAGSTAAAGKKRADAPKPDKSGKARPSNSSAAKDNDSQAAAGDHKAVTAPDPAALQASLDAVDALIDPTRHPIGLLDIESYDRTVNLLLTGAPEPILKGAPVNATSDILWKRLHQEGGQGQP